MKAQYFFSEIFVSAMSSLYSAKLPATVAYKVATLKEEIAKEYDKISKVRQTTIESYYTLVDGEVVKGGDGNPKIENVEGLIKDLNDLNDMEVVLTKSISVDELGNTELSGDEVFVLMKTSILI